MEATDASTNANARALEVSGKSEFDGTVVVDDLDDNAVALETTNTNGGANARALKVTGKTEMSADLDVNGGLQVGAAAAAGAIDAGGKPKAQNLDI